VGEYIHEHLKGSTLKVLDTHGHCAHMSAPEMVIDAMRTYLGTGIEAAPDGVR
jgi:sigma-B regulation protein RsbQ